MQHHASRGDETKPVRRLVPADLYETTPGANGLFHWLLASPLLAFAGWVWVDLFAHYSPLSAVWLDALLGAALFVVGVVAPLGIGAFLIVTAWPRLFQHAGWDVQPLEQVHEAEQYTVRYAFQTRHRASWSWARAWLRAAQGWVFIEIAAILVGGVLMIPLFLSAAEFGFGR
jgi:hypothetical protein